jgi:ribonuclease HII
LTGFDPEAGKQGSMKPSLLSLLQRFREGNVDELHQPLLERERARVEAMWQNEAEAFPNWVVGCDEVGRGPLAGPLVAAAAAAQQPFFVPGLNDSKKLSREEREVLVDLIAQSPIRVMVTIVSVDDISTGNMHYLSLGAMEKSLKKLKVGKPGLVLVDGKYPLGNRRYNQRSLIGGDACSALIAAASIVAKVTRDRIMLKLARKFPHYGWEQNVGYATAEHREALQRLGPSVHHRRNFAPVRVHLVEQLTLEGLSETEELVTA